jgi:hypothetical protein|tara:strand:- start:3097 stop:3438 length:342 start_codon:yes stop_codon:yes gene_type:complete
MNNIVDLVNQYGVPVVVAVGMAYFIFYIWKFVTHKILPSLGQASTTLIALIDRVRMLDNDMIRLDQKIHTIIEIQNQQMDPFENATQKRRDAQQDNKIDTNSEKIKKLQGKKK